MDGVAPFGVLAHVRREAPLHAVMIAVMATAMLSPVFAVGGALLLVLASVVCAALSRAHFFLRTHVVDLWAMALVLLVFLPQHAVGHHVVAVPALAAFALVVVGWAGARVWLVLRSGLSWRMPAASAALTGAGLLAMAVLCA